MLSIRMTSVFVHDPVAAYKFYTETLGFKGVMFVPEAQIAIVAEEIGKSFPVLLLEPNAHPAAKTYQEAIFKEGLPVIVLGAEDIHAEYERLKNAGVVFKSVPTVTDYGIIAVFEDTCGNYIQIHQHL